MPPTFAYAVALAAYVALACVVWSVAIILAIPRGTRPVAKRIAAGMAGSFPGVLLFQLVSAPLAALILLSSGLVMAVTQRGGWVDAVLIGLGVIALGVVALASVVGFYTGWRTAWEWASGRSAREFLINHSVIGLGLRRARRFRSRLPKS